MDVRVSKLPAVQWPAPPFFQLAAPLPLNHGRECVVKLADGRATAGELVTFEPGSDFIELRLEKRDDVQRISLAQVRLIKLTRPLKYVPDTDALKAVGANDHGDHEK